MMRSLLALAVGVLHLMMSLVMVKGFAPLHSGRGSLTSPTVFRPITVLQATAAGGGGGGKKKKKKRRRRKNPPPSATSTTTTTTSVAKAPEASVVSTKETPASVVEQAAPPIAMNQEEEVLVTESPPPQEKEKPKVDKSVIADVANFSFEPDDVITKGIENESSGSGSTSSDDPLVLPDIKDMLKKKELQQEEERLEQEQQLNVKKIKRSDTKAFTKLLESQPYADADDSFFEKEEYGTVSALLGEGSASFLGIPPGPLQVGHFIGALVIFLMAFVEYPGFPLTNLPTPVRECFQGGLATVYLINLVLAVLATFQAEERGQSKVLWGIKTFSVGGLAYDQLTQLPTLQEVEGAQSRKGKRALKNKKR